MTGHGLDRWQYRISDQETPGATPVGRHWLARGPDLAKYPVLDATGSAVGLLLGYPIDLQARQLIDGPWRVRSVAGNDRDSFVRDILWALGGRFLLIFHGGDAVRLYPDCSAQIPCVWDRATGMAGSSAHALFDNTTYEDRLDRALLSDLGVGGEGWLPGGLTAHRGLCRLLPGHLLDLSERKAHRFWPLRGVPRAVDTSAVVEETADLVRSQIEASLGRTKRLGLALTAGRETRLLLACARPYVGQFDSVTVVGSDRHKVDTTIAHQIATDMRLNHIELPRREASKDQSDLFVRRGGHCNGDSNARFHPSIWPIADSHLLYGGSGGEIARAFFWRAEDRENSRITADILMARFGLPKVRAATEALDRWLSDLPVLDTHTILDLAYLEQRMGPWYAVQFGSDPTLVRQAPLVTFRGVELMLSLPPDWKRQSRLGHEIVQRYWPELGRYPINSLGRWQDAALKLQMVLQNPRVVAKKLRKLRCPPVSVQT